MGDRLRRVELAVEPVRGLPLVERHTVSDAWAVNTYAACDIRCTYCITSAQGRSIPRVPPELLAQRLRDELDAVGEIDRMVVGPYCDVYPGPERDLGVTRRALEVLAAWDLGFNLVTKGTTVVRDVDLLRHPGRLLRHPGRLIQISLNTLDEEAIARLEPGAPTAAERLDALHELADRGVRVLVQATPWIPEVTDVLSLRKSVDPAIALQVTPLRLPPHLDRATRALGLTQSEINEAFHREYERIAPLPRVRWSRPPPLDGRPPHIRDNFGREERADWTPAPGAPDPGPHRPWMRWDR